MTFYSRARYWLPLLPLIALLGATYWLNQQVQPGAARPDRNKRHDPDAIVENFSATKMNMQGTPEFILAADRMQHYPDDDSTTLDQPHITMLSADDPTIHATALRGTIYKNGDELALIDNVVLTRDASPPQSELKLRTEYLHFVPDQHLADTDRAVTIADARSTVNATGLQLNSQTRILKLLSQVRSVYVPAKQ